MLKRFLKRTDEKFSLQVLLKVVAVLLILLLLKSTANIWGSWIGTLQAILQPFILGFLIAFILHPMISWLEKKGISKNVSIIVIWILIIVSVVILCVVLLPLLYDKVAAFLDNLIQGVNWVSVKLKTMGELEDFSIIDTITNNIKDLIGSYESWLPGFVATIPSFMSTFLNVITNTLFTIIVAIYMLFDFDRIKASIRRFFMMFHESSGKYLSEIDDDVTVYLKSLLILMLIKFCEYSIFYFLIGHSDWLIIACLSSIGLLVPYLGGTLANAIGVLTALSLDPIRIFLLLAGIVVLSNVDAYVISPMVHEKRSSLGPLITLLAVFAGGVLMGAVGIMFSVPVAIALKAICEVYKKDHQDENLNLKQE